MSINGPVLMKPLGALNDVAELHQWIMKWSLPQPVKRIEATSSSARTKLVYTLSLQTAASKAALVIHLSNSAPF